MMKYILSLVIILSFNVVNRQNQNNVYIRYDDRDTYLILNEPNNHQLLARSIIIHTPDIKSDCFLSQKKNGVRYVVDIINLKIIPEFLSFTELCTQYHINKADQALPVNIDDEINTDPNGLIADKKTIKSVKISIDVNKKRCISISLINPPPTSLAHPDNL